MVPIVSAVIYKKHWGPTDNHSTLMTRRKGRVKREREEIPRGKLSTAGYFSSLMVSLLGASAAGPTCYGRTNMQ